MLVLIQQTRKMNQRTATKGMGFDNPQLNLSVHKDAELLLNKGK